MMNKMIEIVTSTGRLKYHVEKETKENVLINERSLNNKKLRFSKKEGRLEHRVNGKWDVLITDDCVFQFEVYDDDAYPTLTKLGGGSVDKPIEPALTPVTGPALEDVFASQTESALITEIEEVPEEVAPTTEVLRISGNAIIRAFAKMFNIKVKTTKKGELWISLNEDQYKDVLDYLLHDDDVKHMRWETKRGSKKSRIWDDVYGTELIFKSGDGAYLWCTKN